ncbi:MAG: tRNA (adenosine(37)-N6)-threonylcarbamoyltransferase complex dimerization subunit type 1 TsaB [Clostridiales bacterium]|nr:tRNA (adenosine(37)-N6)-threonylcarbamoyltransferase complex dimerization subunit type 1 TsaB [Clostridiales bacterium]
MTKDNKNAAPLILAIDSTATVATVAVTRGRQLMSVSTSDTGHTHSETLLPMIESMLRNLHISIEDIGLFACATGPGSFTGVRIGVSIIKGLAFGRDIPCVSVSPLEALAENLSGLEGIFCPAMDARRNQVYNALFRCQNGKTERFVPDRAIAIADLATELAAFSEMPIYLSGDAYNLLTDNLPNYGIKPELTPELLRRQSAYSVALCGYDAFLSGKTVTAAALSPVYLRLPQAERERLKKQNNRSPS